MTAMDVEGFGDISAHVAVVKTTAGILGIERTIDCGFDP
jgi:hypothetical protein